MDTKLLKCVRQSKCWELVLLCGDKCLVDTADFKFYFWNILCIQNLIYLFPCISNISLYQSSEVTLWIITSLVRIGLEFQKISEGLPRSF